MSIRFAAQTLPHITPAEVTVDQVPVQGWSMELQHQRSRSTLDVAVPASMTDSLDSLLFVNPDDHSDDIGSVIHVYRDGLLTVGGNPKPIASFFSERRGEAMKTQAEESAELHYRHLIGLLDFDSIYPWDFPASPSVEMDWQYGADSILENGDFESGGNLNEQQAIWRNELADGGTWDASFQGDTVANIDWDVSSGDLQTALQSGFSTIISLSVSGSGSEADPWIVEFTDPGEIDYPEMTVDGTDLTATGEGSGPRLDTGQEAIYVQTLSQGGVAGLSGWTINQRLDTGQQLGEYASNGFGVSSAVALSGSYSLRINGLSQYAGAQQVVQTVPGLRYVASVWVFTSSTTDLFRLVVRNRFEELISWTTPIEQTVPANTWTQFTTNFIADDNYAVFRFAYVGDGNPLPFYLDDASLAPGEAPATIGKIWLDVITDTQSLHPGGLRTQSLLWLNPTWDEDFDSAGNPWPGEHSLTVPEGVTLLQLTEHHQDQYGYEFDMRMDPDDGNIYMDMFVPGGGGETPDPEEVAIVIGPGIVGGERVSSAPTASKTFVRGSDGLWWLNTNYAMETAWGPRDRYISARDAHSVEDMQAIGVAQGDLVDASTIGLQFEVANHGGHSIPGLHYQVSDYVTTTPGADTAIPPNARRVQSLRISGKGGEVDSISVDVGSEVFGSLGLAAQAEAVRRLLRKIRFQEPVSVGSSPFAIPSGGGGMFTVSIAAADANTLSQGSATQTAPEGDSLAALQSVTDLVAINGGRINLSEGTFPVDVASGIGFTVGSTDSTQLVGMGSHATTINSTNAATSADNPIVEMIDEGAIVQNLSIQGYGTGLVYSGSYGTIRSVYFSTVGTQHLTLEGFFNIVEGCIFDGDGIGIDLQCDYAIIRNCYFANDGDAIQVAAGTDFVIIEDCYFDNYGIIVKLLGDCDNIVLRDNQVNGATCFVDTQSFGNTDWIISGNTVYADEGILGYAERIRITDNHIIVFSGNPAIQLIAPDSGYQVVIAGNIIDSGYIYVEGVNDSAAQGGASTIHDNVVFEPSDNHGIELVECTDMQVHHNDVVSLFNTANTYDGILLTSCHRARVDHNTVRAVLDGFGDGLRYGINISGGTDCRVVGNDLGATADYGTAPIVATGTGHQLTYPNHGTYGDNFT